MVPRSVRAIALTLALALALCGCGLSIPTDPEGTLDRVSGGVLRVAISDNPPFTEIHDDGPPTGAEVELVTEFASTLNSEIQFLTGGEEALVTEMEKGDADLLIGGLTDKSPWFEKVALTGPYTTIDRPDGTESSIVMAVPLGENAFLVALEDFLQHRHSDRGSER